MQQGEVQRDKLVQLKETRGADDYFECLLN